MDKQLLKLEKTMRQICKFCKSEIDGDCYKCPVCREWLHPFRLRKDNPLLKRTLFLLLFFLVIMFMPRFIASKYLLDQFTMKEFQSAEKHGLKIVWHKLNDKRTQKIIFGELKNEGSDSFSSVDIESYFYDKSNNFIKIENTFLTGNIKPGEKRLFQIKYLCDCGKDSQVPDSFNRYELKIVDGRINSSKNE